MRPGRVLIAAIVGGIITFGWGAVSHMFTPLGHMGLQTLPPQQDQMIMNALNFSLKDRGFYMFPPCDEKACADTSTEAGKNAWDDYSKKYSAGPRGVIIFDPQTGVDAMGPKMLGTEFASNLLAALFLAFIIARAGGGAGAGAIIGIAAGIFAALSIDVSYWNWYRFPRDMAIASLIEQSIGGLVTGLVIGLIMGKRRNAASAAPYSA